MPERLEENNHPLNQAAKRALKKLLRPEETIYHFPGQIEIKAPDPEFLYSLQLMLWSLAGKEKNQSQREREEREDLKDYVERMIVMPPEQAMKIILRALREENHDPESPELIEGDPLNLAGTLVSSLLYLMQSINLEIK